MLSDAARKIGKNSESNKDSLKLLAYSTYLKQLERTENGDPAKRDSTLRIDCCQLNRRSDRETGQNKRRSGRLGQETLRDPRGIYFIDLSEQDHAQVSSGKLAFMFSGQGSQHVDMLKDMTMAFSDVRQTFERANSVLKDSFAGSLSSYNISATDIYRVRKS